MSTTLSFILVLFSSLMVVFILFKFLRSKAIIISSGLSSTKKKISGGAAGFVIIFSLIFGFYKQVYGTISIEEHETELKKLEMQLKPEIWKIRGKVVSNNDHNVGIAGIMVRPIPQIVSYTDSNGEFILEDFIVYPDTPLGALQFSCSTGQFELRERIISRTFLNSNDDDKNKEVVWPEDIILYPNK